MVKCRHGWNFVKVVYQTSLNAVVENDTVRLLGRVDSMREVIALAVVNSSASMRGDHCSNRWLFRTEVFFVSVVCYF